MRITFLGTGTSQGVPVIACTCDACMSQDPKDKRLRSSVLIEDGENVILIDTGPDFRQQMLQARVEHLDAILFTHEHRDHIAGLDDIRAYNYIQKQSMEVYGDERVLMAVQHTFPYIFSKHKYPGIPKLNFNRIENKSFSIGGSEVIPIAALHHRLPVFGFRIGDFAYITDANFIAPEEIKKIRGIRHFAICALRKKEHLSHFNLDQALEVIRDVQPQQAYLTHISHLMGPQKETAAELPENVCFSWDMQSIEI